MMQTRVLVTGGAGFIGANLCKRLVAEGQQVIALDNLYTGRLENLAGLLERPDFTFIKADVREPIKLETKVNEIYHAACPASPCAYQGVHALETTKTCVLGSLNVLELAKEQGARVMLFSTSEVYGDPLCHPQQESYWGNVNPIGGRSCYDEGKRVAESLFFDYHRIFSLPIKIVRIFNTYGPLMDPKDGRVISNFICSALRGEPLTVYGTGEQTRSFCYIEDLLNGLVSLMHSAESFTGPVNLGNDKEFKVLDAARLILKLTASGSGLAYQTLPLDDPKVRRPDLTLAKAQLNYQPKVSLEDGLLRTIAYFKDRLQV